MTELEKQLQQSLALIHGEPPLPLHGIGAVTQAKRLRGYGLPYSSIAVVMTRYHGDARSGDAWRRMLRGHGVPGLHHLNGSRRIPPQLQDER